MLGEHKISSDPDCPNPRKRGVFRNGKNKNCFAKVIRRRVDKIINHENYDPTKIKNDIALIRLAEPVPLFKDDPKGSPAMPICLPWDDDLVARDLFEGINLHHYLNLHFSFWQRNGLVFHAKLDFGLRFAPLSLHKVYP